MIIVVIDNSYQSQHVSTQTLNSLDNLNKNLAVISLSFYKRAPDKQEAKS